MMDALSETQPGRRVDRRQLAAIGRWLAISLVSGPVVATCVVARRPATGRYFDALPHSSPSGPTARLSGLSGRHPPNSCRSCPVPSLVPVLRQTPPCTVSTTMSLPSPKPVRPASPATSLGRRFVPKGNESFQIGHTTNSCGPLKQPPKCSYVRANQATLLRVLRERTLTTSPVAVKASSDGQGPPPREVAR